MVRFIKHRGQVSNYTKFSNDKFLSWSFLNNRSLESFGERKDKHVKFYCQNFMAISSILCLVYKCTNSYVIIIILTRRQVLKKYETIHRRIPSKWINSSQTISCMFMQIFTIWCSNAEETKMIRF